MRNILCLFGRHEWIRSRFVWLGAAANEYSVQCARCRKVESRFNRSSPAIGGAPAIQISIAGPERKTCLGEVNAGGEIWTTCGWSKFGRAWVTERQIAAAETHGWSRTGKTAPFQGYTLHELIRERSE